jgi:hypothetical protein
VAQKEIWRIGQVVGNIVFGDRVVQGLVVSWLMVVPVKK